MCAMERKVFYYCDESWRGIKARRVSGFVDPTINGEIGVYKVKDKWRAVHLPTGWVASREDHPDCMSALTSADGHVRGNPGVVENIHKRMVSKEHAMYLQAILDAKLAEADRKERAKEEPWAKKGVFFIRHGGDDEPVEAVLKEGYITSHDGYRFGLYKDHKYWEVAHILSGLSVRAGGKSRDAVWKDFMSFLALSDVRPVHMAFSPIINSNDQRSFIEAVQNFDIAAYLSQRKEAINETA